MPGPGGAAGAAPPGSDDVPTSSTFTAADTTAADATNAADAEPGTNLGLLDKKASRPCTKCYCILYRYTGCDSMTCHCGHRFDWGAAKWPKPGDLVSKASSSAKRFSTVTETGRPS